MTIVSISVGTSTGDLEIWDVGLDEKLVYKTFEVWDASNCTTKMQVSLLSIILVMINLGEGTSTMLVICRYSHYK